MWGRALCASIFFRQHDRQHTGDDGFSIWTLDFWLLIQIDLEKDFVPVGIERAKVVLFVRVVGVTKVVVDLDGLDDPRFGAAVAFFGDTGLALVMIALLESRRGPLGPFSVKMIERGTAAEASQALSES